MKQVNLDGLINKINKDIKNIKVDGCGTTDISTYENEYYTEDDKGERFFYNFEKVKTFELGNGWLAVAIKIAGEERVVKTSLFLCKENIRAGVYMNKYNKKEFMKVSIYDYIRDINIFRKHLIKTIKGKKENDN